MAATAGTTTIELPVPLRARLARLKQHPRQPYHEVIQRAVEALEGRAEPGTLDPLVAQHRVALRVAARRNKITRLWLFGSRARRTARPDSDVDLLVQTGPDASLFDIGGFIADAEGILGCKVDVADIDGLKPDFRARVLPEAVPL
jgi:predicted nucleotidyltransferase